MLNRIVWSGALVLLLAGAPGRALPYEAVTVTNGGTIEGVVKLTAPAPTVPPIKTTKNQDYCGMAIPNPIYSTGKDGGLQNVEVFLKGIQKGKANLTGTITLTNEHCMFQPRVQGASVGEQIKIASDDPILHNTHPQVDATNATIYNIALPYKGFSVTKPLPPNPELIRVKCDAHEWMRAWIWEFDHPYYATTDADGHFKITDVPPGTYTVVAWHEVMGQKESSATVAAGKPATVDFSFTPKK
ncbi:MAG: carboxypeptidase regulatory-like domain-containing protein [Thermoanaerobaculia bacterium]